jgi:hypothetical protein
MHHYISHTPFHSFPPLQIIGTKKKLKTSPSVFRSIRKKKLFDTKGKIVQYERGKKKKNVKCKKGGKHVQVTT